MLLAYIDESGNKGDINSGGSLTFTLGCVLVDVDAWPAAFDALLGFRRRVRTKFGVPMRAEIKANYLLRNSGDLRPLGLAPRARNLIYRAHMRILRELPARAFAVVIDKRTDGLTPDGRFDQAWETLLQRLSRTSSAENCTFMVMHDEGENDAVRRWTRRARRHLTAGSAFGTGALNVNADRLVDDPIPLRSNHSYWIQTADLVAYAAFRSVIPPGNTAAGQICPQSMWTEIGPATHSAVNRLKRIAAPGIVLRK